MIQYNTIQCNPRQDNTMKNSSMQYNIRQNDTMKQKTM